MIRAKYFILVATVGLSVAFDQVTKRLVLTGFKLGESVPVLGDFFHLTYVRNTGAAFGFLAHANEGFRVPFFIAVPVLALFAVAYVFRRIQDDDRKLSFALSLVIGGAIGNLLDRLRLGFVVDFLDFHWHEDYHFPAFNIADSAICIGVGILMLDLIMQEQLRESKRHAPTSI